jgi:hypothetical protein
MSHVAAVDETAGPINNGTSALSTSGCPETAEDRYLSILRRRSNRRSHPVQALSE